MVGMAMGNQNQINPCGSKAELFEPEAYVPEGMEMARIHQYQA